MAKGTSAASAILLCILILAGTPSRADESGCAALAESVKSGVAAARARALRGYARRTGGYASRGGTVAPALAGRHTCSATAAVASRAFGEALRGLNVSLSWRDNWIRPGDYCRSHDLRQCYPSHDPLSPLPPPAEFAFVQQAWRSVTRALESQMPYGSGGDLSSFTDTSLDSALSTELRAAFGRAARAESLREVADDRFGQQR